MAYRNRLMSLPIVCALSLGIALGRMGAADRQTEAQTPQPTQPGGATSTPAPPKFTMTMRIGSNLYLQTSAEYHAACLQTYRCAETRLRKLVDSKLFDPQRRVVIMDLDETVFDNSAFQTYLYKTGQEYTDELWADYEQNFPQDVTPIPGAKEFISRAEAMGVGVVYLSNRSEKFQSSTVAALNRLEIAGVAIEDRLFLKAKDATSSEKSTRRDRIRARYDVMMLIGDNLRDFSEDFAQHSPIPDTAPEILAAVAERKKVVENEAFHWGNDWFILPNPVYGEWDKAIKVDPIELMHPTSMKTPSGAR